MHIQQYSWPFYTYIPTHNVLRFLQAYAHNIIHNGDAFSKGIKPLDAVIFHL